MKYLISISLSFLSASTFAQVPDWAKSNTISKNGSIVTSICEGKGSSISIARQEAIQNCQLSVAQFLNGEVKINSISVETERDIGFHQQVEQKLNVKKLVCEPVKDEVVQIGEAYSFWIKCRFDFSKVEISNDSEVEPQKIMDMGLKSTSIIKTSDLNDGRVILIETIPQCNSVLVKGVKARIINCKSNPVKIVIYAKDTEMVIRRRDFQSKTIKINGGRSNEKISVLLERN